MKKYLSMLMILTMVLQVVPVAFAGTGPVVTDQFGNKGGNLLGFDMPAAANTSTNTNFFTGTGGNVKPIQNTKGKQTTTTVNPKGNNTGQICVIPYNPNQGLTGGSGYYVLNGLGNLQSLLTDPNLAPHLQSTQGGQSGPQYQYNQSTSNMSEADKQREQRRWEMTFAAQQANRSEDRKYSLIEKQLAQQNAQMLNQAAMQNAQINAQQKQQNMDRIMQMTMMTFGMFAQYKTQRNEQKAYQHEQDANRAFYQQKDKMYYDNLRQQNRYQAFNRYQTQTQTPSWMSQSTQYGGYPTSYK